MTMITTCNIQELMLLSRGKQLKKLKQEQTEDRKRLKRVDLIRQHYFEKIERDACEYQMHEKCYIPLKSKMASCRIKVLFNYKFGVRYTFKEFTNGTVLLHLNSVNFMGYDEDYGVMPIFKISKLIFLKNNKNIENDVRKSIYDYIMSRCKREEGVLKNGTRFEYIRFIKKENEKVFRR